MMFVINAIVRKMNKLLYTPLLVVLLLGWFLSVNPSVNQEYWEGIGPKWNAILNPVNLKEFPS
jgi:hypothetical protein